MSQKLKNIKIINFKNSQPHLLKYSQYCKIFYLKISLFFLRFTFIQIYFFAKKVIGGTFVLEVILYFIFPPFPRQQNIAINNPSFRHTINVFARNDINYNRQRMDCIHLSRISV